MKYIIGLDLGVSSVGWAVLPVDTDGNVFQVKDCGVRTFPEGSNPKDGSSHNKARRDARLIRRTTRRRAGRMKVLRRLFIQFGLVTETEIDDLFCLGKKDLSPWRLRAEGLERKLSKYEWARVLAHVTKHRGFLSNRKNDKSAQSEKGLLEGLKANHELMSKGQYKTIGEMIFKDTKFAQHKRNKNGAYTHSIQRLDVAEEIEQLFSAQHKLGNEFCTEEFKTAFFIPGAKFELTPIFSSQRPVFSKDQIKNTIGRCTFEENEIRAAKHSFSAETFILLQKLKNLRYSVDGEEHSLTEDQQKELYEKAKSTKANTYKSIAKFLKLDREKNLFSFKGLHYAKNKSDDENEKTTFFEMKGFHDLKKALTNHTDAWENIKQDIQCMDFIAEALTLYKTDDDIKEQLRTKNLSEEVINALLSVSFTKHINLSFKALYKINPLLQDGMSYVDACTQIYGSHSRMKVNKKSKFLPVFETLDDPDLFIANPTVMRTITQTRKIVNAIVRTYGSPWKVHIENTRDLSRSHTERKRITSDIKKNEDERNKIKATLLHEYDYKNPTNTDIQRMRLYQEQNGQCAYSGHSLYDAIKNQQTQVDHILPFSRSFDDSQSNKVLVLATENQNKKHDTPFEYFRRIGRDWDEFSRRIKLSTLPYAKKNKLLNKTSDFNGFQNSSLSDTAYSSRVIGHYIKNYLAFLEDENTKERVFYTQGRITSLVRNLWHINGRLWGKKNRNNDRHHAIDAIVVASITPSVIKRISDAARQEKNLARLKITMPYPEFCTETHLKVFGGSPLCSEENAQDTQALKDTLEGLRPEIYTEEELQFVRPLFVSRMANRKITGQSHQETIKSPKEGADGTQYLVVRKNLSSLSEKDIENMWGKESDPKLYQAIKARLKEFNYKADKAFADKLYKPGQNSPVRSIKVKKLNRGGRIAVHNKNQAHPAYAERSSIIRTDIFTDEKGKFYLVPLYASDVCASIIPNGAIVAQKQERLNMDECFAFLMSIFQNDLIRVHIKEKEFFGYYQGMDSSTASISMLPHDRGEAFLNLENKKPEYNEKGRLINAERSGIGVKTAACIQLYSVNLLGYFEEVKARPKRQALNPRQVIPSHQQ